jgi:hypothetical protein
MKSILLACPISEYKDYILPQWLDYIKTLIIPEGYSLSYLFVDNSLDIRHFRKLKNNYFDIKYRPPYKNERLNDTMKSCLNIIRKKVVEEEFHYFFSLECDIFPPKDILINLLNHKEAVVSACYNIGFNDTRRLMLQYPNPKENGTIDVKNVSLMEGFKAINGDLIKVYGCGIGCTLIRWDVLENYLFRTDPSLEVHADTFFHVDLYERNFESWLDTSIFCRHYNSSWNAIKKINEKRRIR